MLSLYRMFPELLSALVLVKKHKTKATLSLPQAIVLGIAIAAAVIVSRILEKLGMPRKNIGRVTSAIVLVGMAVIIFMNFSGRTA